MSAVGSEGISEGIVTFSLGVDRWLKEVGPMVLIYGAGHVASAL